MEGGLSSTFNGTYSSSCAIYADSQDEAELGSHIPLSKLTQQPLETRKALSTRSTHRSSDSTLAEQSLPGDTEHRRVPPRQNQQPPHSSWIARWFSFVPQLFAIQSRETSHSHLPSAWQEGYAKFEYDSYERCPDGYPRVASFMDGCESFGIFRRFGQVYSRLLIHRMSDITDMEKELSELDKIDESGVQGTKWRLKRRYHEDAPNNSKNDLLDKMEKKVINYSTLLLQYQRLKVMDQAPARDHNSVFKWIFERKPLDEHEYDWIYKPEDFVSVVPPCRNIFEDSIRNHLDAWPKSWFKGIFKTQKQLRYAGDSKMEFWSIPRIAICARLVVVFIAVLVLFIPVILFLLTSMSRAWMAVVVLSFDFIFCVMISLLTNAGIQEIFVGTSTY